MLLIPCNVQHCVLNLKCKSFIIARKNEKVKMITVIYLFVYFASHMIVSLYSLMLFTAVLPTCLCVLT